MDNAGGACGEAASLRGMNNEPWDAAQPFDRATGWHGVGDGSEGIDGTGDVPYADGYPRPRPYPPNMAAPTLHGYGVSAIQPVQFTPPPGLIDPVTGEHLSNKSKVLAGLLQFTVGWFGVGRFYLGDSVRGGAQIAMFFAAMFLAGFDVDLRIIWALTAWCIGDAIYIWAGRARDQYGRRLR